MRMTNAEFKTRREALGLTSRDLADLIGVQQATVTGWEAGIRPIPDRRAEQLQDLSSQFRQQVDELAGQDGEIIWVPRNDSERTDLSWPARWQRLVGLQAAQRAGKQIRYIKGNNKQ